MSKVVRWWEFAVNRKESGVLYATGYDCRTLDFIWDKHGTNLVTMLSLLQRPVEESALHIAAYFFLGLKYIHHYPRWNKSVADILFTSLTGRITVQKFYSRIVPTLMSLAELVDEIHWSDRLHPMNHGTHMFQDR